jgi:hypothetical protein
LFAGVDLRERLGVDGGSRQSKDAANLLLFLYRDLEKSWRLVPFDMSKNIEVGGGISVPLKQLKPLVLTTSSR